MASLTLLDIVVLLCVGGGAILGLVRGFVFEVLSLFAWAAVVVALKLFFAPATLMLSAYISTKAGAGLLAFAIIAGVTFVGGRLVAARMGRRTRASVLGPVDRGLGFGFGAIKGLIGVTLLYMGFNLAYDIGYGGGTPRPDWVRHARSYTLLRASRWAIDDLLARRRGLPPPPHIDDDAPANGSASANSTN